MKTSLTGLILIVDDNSTNLDVISKVLKNAGYKVAIATTGERAIQQAEKRPPDLILLDVMMPGIDGFQTCKRLKSNTKTYDIPIIFMTALDDTDHKVKGFDLGAVDYITKPFQEEEVLVRVRTHLQLNLLTKNLEEQVAYKTAALQASQLQIIQSDKLSSLGNLVAGVAHEINNPVGFLTGNIQPALDYITDLFGLLNLIQEKSPQLDPEIQAEIERIDLDYIRQDLPKLIGSMQEGVKRIKDISASLRAFSRADNDRPVPCNIHDGIDSTVMILKHRLKANETHPEIQVIKNYGDLPEITCYAGQLNQVFMNLLSNAIDALEESNQGRDYQEIANQVTITTELQHFAYQSGTKTVSSPRQAGNSLSQMHLQGAVSNNQVIIIRIRDNGIGMSPDLQKKVFDYLFTTKEVGKGTGLGLAIARQIVVEKHGGVIKVNSELGQGTEFIIQLPS